MVRIVKNVKDADVFTHPAPHHGDDIFAVAMLDMLYDGVNIMRTRNLKLMDENPNALRIDVGGVYDPEKGRFDHHQRNFNMTHSVKYVESRKNKFIIINNPNPNDDVDCYVSVDQIKGKPIKYFSKPLKKWALTINDEAKIDKLVKQKFGKEKLH